LKEDTRARKLSKFREESETGDRGEAEESPDSMGEDAG